MANQEKTRRAIDRIYFEQYGVKERKIEIIKNDETLSDIGKERKIKMECELIDYDIKIKEKIRKLVINYIIFPISQKFKDSEIDECLGENIDSPAMEKLYWVVDKEIKYLIESDNFYKIKVYDILMETKPSPELEKYIIENKLPPITISVFLKQNPEPSFWSQMNEEKPN